MTAQPSRGRESFGAVERPKPLGLPVPDELLDALADRVAARVLEALPGIGGGEAPSPWLDVAGAADYLRCKPKRLHDLSSQRRVPVHREGSRLLFHRGELDEWIRSGAADTALTPAADPASEQGSRGAARISDPRVTGRRDAA